jgi:hypothetical protein
LKYSWPCASWKHNSIRPNLGPIVALRISEHIAGGIECASRDRCLCRIASLEFCACILIF